MSEHGSAGDWYLVAVESDGTTVTIRKCKSRRKPRAMREAQRFGYECKVFATVSDKPLGVVLGDAIARIDDALEISH